MKNIEVKVDNYLIERTNFALRQSFPVDYISEVKLRDSYLADFGRQIVMTFDGYVATRLVDKKTVTAVAECKAIASVEFPSSVFQHFKREYFPKWLLEKYPVEYTKIEQVVEKVEKATETFDIRQCFPDRILPEERSYIACFQSPRFY